MAGRAAWYIVMRKGTLATTSTIEGIRQIDKKVLVGTILPGEFFRDVPDTVFNDLFVGGYRAIEAYTPSAEELPLLYTLYPKAMPKSVPVPANGASSLKNKWYKVNSHDFMLWGVTALATVKGICKAGDTAFAAEIVPAQFFAGLSIEQLNRLERIGAASPIVMNTLETDWHGVIMNAAPIARYAPNAIELLRLYEKFPAANPETPIVNQEEKEGSE